MKAQSNCSTTRLWGFCNKFSFTLLLIVFAKLQLWYWIYSMHGTELTCNEEKMKTAVHKIKTCEASDCLWFIERLWLSCDCICSCHLCSLPSSGLYIMSHYLQISIRNKSSLQRFWCTHWYTSKIIFCTYTIYLCTLIIIYCKFSWQRIETVAVAANYCHFFIVFLHIKLIVRELTHNVPFKLMWLLNKRRDSVVGL